VVIPIGNVDPEVSDPAVDSHETWTDAPNLSTAVGVVHDSVAPDALVAVAIRSDGVPEIVGGFLVSLTVIRPVAD
jgi:hypothetical protein